MYYNVNIWYIILLYIILYITVHYTLYYTVHYTQYNTSGWWYTQLIINYLAEHSINRLYCYTRPSFPKCI